MSLTLLNLQDARRATAAASEPRPLSGARRAAEAVSPALLLGQDPEGFRPYGTSRRFGSALTSRDLNPVLHARMQQVAYYLYLVNPLAHRIVEYTKNYVVGDGVSVKAEDPAAGRVVETFWQDSVNRMDFALPEFVKELGIFGEQCWLAAVNPLSGRVRLAYLDPAEIDAVEWGELAIGADATGAAGTVSVPVAILRRRAPGETEPRRFRIIRPDEDPESPTFGQLVGECFYFAINKARTASRGVSDLFAIGDYLDGYDKMLFGLIDRVGFSNAFIWDVLLKGATEENIQEWLKEQRPPRPGSVRAHNEQVEWKTVSPSLQAQDFNEAARTIKNMNLAGAGFPEHWFAEGGNVNRASALEMGDPTLKTLVERQGFAAFMVRQVIEFVIDQAVAAGTLPETVNRKFHVQMPEMSVRDMGKAAQALSHVGTTVMELRRAQLIDTESAQELVASVALQLGVEMDLEAVRRRLAAAGENPASAKPGSQEETA
ncbi:MAG: hypothetical protein IH846_06255 [Acidobacteria bacterium]|nr:hypothetical protein [Acidobacteriota bacterium]